MKSISRFVAPVLLLFLTLCACAGNQKKQPVYQLHTTDADIEIFNKFISDMDSKRNLPLDELLVEAAKYFLETPYVTATLEVEPEGLVVNLRELDCTTYVDNIIALTRTLKSKDPSFETYCDYLFELRYRDGQIADYTDRIHYTSDWIYENSKRGVIKDITQASGGELYPMEINFMSTHPDSYKQLRGNPDRIKRIEQIEQEITKRTYYYIPEDKIADSAPNLKSGDVVCFVSTVKGLDLAHLGMIYWEGDKLTFIHASSTGEKVIINPDPIDEYVKRIKSNSGIMVVRLVDKY